MSLKNDKQPAGAFVRASSDKTVIEPKQLSSQNRFRGKMSPELKPLLGRGMKSHVSAASLPTT